MKRLGLCQNCHRPRKINRKGVVKTHRHPYADMLCRCRGAGQPPIAGSVVTAR